MRTLSWKDIAEQIKTDSEINFIGRAMTPLHVLGVETFLLSLIERGIKCKGYILTVAHCQTGLALNENSFHSSLYEGVEPIYMEDLGEPKGKILTLLHAKKHDESNQTFYYANPYRVELGYISELLNLRPHDRLEITVTEEGIASYGSNPYKLTRALVIGLGVKQSIRFLLEASIKDRYLTKNIERALGISYFLMLNKVDGRWKKNEIYARNVIKILSSNDRKEDEAKYEDAIVFCPSPLYEAGIIKKRQDLKIYCEIIDMLGRDKKYIVRPHPREKDKEAYAVLGCTVDDRLSSSLEEILAELKNKPRFIIGDSSTALVNASALFGIRTISINKLFDRSILSDKNYFYSFNSLFSNICSIPNSFDELRESMCIKEL